MDIHLDENLNLVVTIPPEIWLATMETYFSQKRDKSIEMKFVSNRKDAGYLKKYLGKRVLITEKQDELLSGVVLDTKERFILIHESWFEPCLSTD